MMLQQQLHASSRMLTGLVGVGGGRSKEKLQKRLKAAMEDNIDNHLCADCSELAPTWACILENPVDRTEFQLGLFCCGECAASFRELLETDIIRELKDTQKSSTEWTEEEIKTLENTGNKVTNSIYEARLEPGERDEERLKSGYMRRKYQTLKYFTTRALEDAKEKMEEDQRQKVEQQKQKEEKKKAEKERRKAEKKERKNSKKKKDGEVSMEDSNASLFNESFATDDELEDSAEKQQNGATKVVRAIEEPDEEEEAKVAAEAARRPLRRRRSGRGLADMTGGDPLRAQSDHVPMNRRGRSQRGLGGSQRGLGLEAPRKSRPAERAERDNKRAAASHSPVPGRVTRPGRSKPHDSLGSQSDHVALNRRKRSTRSLQQQQQQKEIQWEPKRVSESVLHASLDLDRSSTENDKQSIAASFSTLGFQDVDYSTFQNRVAPTPMNPASAIDAESANPTSDPAESDPSSEPDPPSEPDPSSEADPSSEPDFSQPDFDPYEAAMDIDLSPMVDDSDEMPTETPKAPAKRTISKGRSRRSVSPMRKRESSRSRVSLSGDEQLEEQKSMKRVTSSDSVRKRKNERPRRSKHNDSFSNLSGSEQLEETDMKRVPSSDSVRKRKSERPRRSKKNDSFSELSGSEPFMKRVPSSDSVRNRKNERPRRSKRNDSFSELGTDETNPKDNSRERKPRAKRTMSGRDVRIRTVPVPDDDEKARRMPARSKSDRRVRPERPNMARASSAYQGRRAKMSSSLRSLNFDHLAPVEFDGKNDDDDDDDDEEEVGGEDDDQPSEEAVEDEKDGEGKEKKSKLKAVKKLVKSTGSSVKNTVKSTGSTVKNTVKSTGSTVKNTVKSTGSTVKNTVKSTGNTVKKTVKSTVNTIDPRKKKSSADDPASDDEGSDTFDVTP